MIRHLTPQTLRRYTPWEDSHDHRISNWMAPWDGAERCDAGMVSALLLPVSGMASTSPVSRQTAE